MKTANRFKSRAWRLIQKIDGVGKSRDYCKKHGLLSSLNTKKKYHSCVALYLMWVHENGLSVSEQDKLDNLCGFLSEISEIYMQKTLGQYKSALSITFKKKLPHFKSEIPDKLKSRDYFLSEVLLIIENLQERNAISILLCFFSGLRAHEISTLKRRGEIQISKTRKWISTRFTGASSCKIYLVKGKGGLVREVSIPNQLVEIIEKFRLDSPVVVSDRGIKYGTHYDLGFGKALSVCFSRASKKILNWSTGLHGLRHAYAQNRMFQLLGLDVNYDDALKIVSQELGHFRPSITLCYLR